MKNFLFYAGNARAGSTWLYGALNARGDCDFSHIKEHFLFVEGFSLTPDFDKNDFFDLYAKLGENPQVKLLGEFCVFNGYASIDQLLWFKEEAAKKNFNVLPVMTLRDPINKMASECKLVENTRRIKEMAGDNEQLFQDIMRDTRKAKIPRPIFDMTFDIVESCINKTPFCEREVTWETTINNLTEVFGKVHINFYETLFTEESMQSLCNYLQIPMSDFDYSFVRNKQGDGVILTDEQKQIVFDNQKYIPENYQFAVERFGKDFIESIWWTPNK